jgi:cytochrome P450
MGMRTMATAARIDLYDADQYVEGPPHAAFAELRRSEPVSWQERPNGPGYWAILRHADIREVARRPDLFSAHANGVQIEMLAPEQLKVSSGKQTNMDPPRHALYREPLMAIFTPRRVAPLEARIREIARGILAQAAELMEQHGRVEFVHEVCSPLPTRVFGELAGLPPESWDYLHDCAARLTRAQDPEVVQGEDDKRNAGAEMLAYAMEFGARRRGEPPRDDDLAGVLLGHAFEGRPLTDFEFGTHFSQFIVGGNETTVTLLSSGLQVLLEHPDQLARLRADPSLIPGALEEILRYANPLHYLARTAVAEVEMHGQRIGPGDKVAMYYTSGNRDEAVFAEPDRFDIGRSPNPHLALGYATHFCMGAHLARLEARVFFEELLATFPRIEPAGEPRRLRSNFNNALKHFPVALYRS